jgi:hypothetical protein
MEVDETPALLPEAPEIQVVAPEELELPSLDAPLLEQVKDAYSEDKQFTADWCSLHLLTQRTDGLWYKGSALVVPKARGLRSLCLSLVHDTPYSGHPGIGKTLKLATRLFWWPSLHQDVLKYVGSCPFCQRNKSAVQAPAGLLQSLPVPGRRWESISVDFITKLPLTRSGNDAICVFVDRLSKMIHLEPCKTSIDTLGTAKLYVKRVLSLHGVPRSIISDRGPQFASALWRAMHRLMGATVKLSSAYHPQTDGGTERVNRTLEAYLRHYVSPRHDDWDEWLPMAEFAYNNSYHETVKNTPFFLNFGQHPLTPVSALIDTDVPAARDFTDGLAESIQLAKAAMQEKQQQQKAYADRGKREVSFRAGDKVLLSTKNLKLKTPGTRKLLRQFIGPYEVLNPVGVVSYRLKLPKRMRVYPVFHVSLLKAYTEPAEDREALVQPVELEVEGDAEGVPTTVLDHRVKGAGRRGRPRIEYLVDLSGSGPEGRKWVRTSVCPPALLQLYWAGRPGAPAKYRGTGTVPSGGGGV